MTAEPISSPTIPDAWIAPVVRLHTAAEANVLAFVTVRLGVGLASPDWAAQRQVTTPFLRRDLDGLVAKLTREATPLVADLIAKAYREAYPTAHRPDGLIEQLLAILRDIWARIRSAGLGIFQQALGAAPVAAPDARRAAVQRTLDRAADRGIVAYRDTRGRQWGLGPAVSTLVGDAAHGAGTIAFTDRLLADGGDLVIVTESPHPCPICQPWEHKVLSVTGTDPDRPSVAVARAAGLFHPHCRHTVFAWAPGFRWPEHSVEHLPGSYEAEQRQRQIEAHIRRWKRREAAALDDIAAAKARRHIRAWQAELRTHLARTGLQRSRMRERVDFRRTSPTKHALGA